jgi:hypothetical protein
LHRSGKLRSLRTHDWAGAHTPRTHAGVEAELPLRGHRGRAVDQSGSTPPLGAGERTARAPEAASRPVKEGSRIHPAAHRRRQGSGSVRAGCTQRNEPRGSTRRRVEATTDRVSRSSDRGATARVSRERDGKPSTRRCQRTGGRRRGASSLTRSCERLRADCRSDR